MNELLAQTQDLPLTSTILEQTQLSKVLLVTIQLVFVVPIRAMVGAPEVILINLLFLTIKLLVGITLIAPAPELATISTNWLFSKQTSEPANKIAP